MYKRIQEKRIFTIIQFLKRFNYINMLRKNSGRINRKLFSVVILVEDEKTRDFAFYCIYLLFCLDFYNVFIKLLQLGKANKIFFF